MKKGRHGKAFCRSILPVNEVWPGQHCRATPKGGINLLTIQVRRYCLLAFQSRTHVMLTYMYPPPPVPSAWKNSTNHSTQPHFFVSPTCQSTLPSGPLDSMVRVDLWSPGANLSDFDCNTGDCEPSHVTSTLLF